MPLRRLKERDFVTIKPKSVLFLPRFFSRCAQKTEVKYDTILATPGFFTEYNRYEVKPVRLLLVEDERAMTDALHEAFLKSGYTVQVAYDGTEGMRIALNECFDVIVLDVMLPGHSGLSILRALRQNKRSTPVMLLTARAEVSDRVVGLDCGADDYLTKPFALEELLARVRALARRSGELEKSDALHFSDITLLQRAYMLSRGQESVRLSKRETEIFSYILQRKHMAVQKEDLYTRVWGYDSTADSSIVEVYISFLRKKLAHIHAHVEIQSVRGVGYRMLDTL